MGKKSQSVLVTVVSFLLAIFWGGQTLKYYSSGDMAGAVIMLISCILFAVGFIISLVSIFKK